MKCTIEFDKEETLSAKHRTSTNWKKISEKLNQINSTRYLAIEDPDVLVESLMNDVDRCKRESTTSVKGTRYDTPIKQWITKEILQKMRKRDKL